MSENHIVTLLMSEFVTHNVKRFVVSRPPGFTFIAGQGVELAIRQPQWQDQPRPFTPTSLNDEGVLEFVIKRYTAHEGVTRELHNLSPGVELLLSEPFGTISYQGTGVFIAAGAGITPFIAILRERAIANNLSQNTLIFSNKTPADIICEKELRYYLGDRCILTCTATQAPGYEYGRVDKAFLVEKIDNFEQNFYVCGPPGFTQAVTGSLTELGADAKSLIFER